MYFGHTLILQLKFSYSDNSLSVFACALNALKTFYHVFKDYLYNACCTQSFRFSYLKWNQTACTYHKFKIWFTFVNIVIYGSVYKSFLKRSAQEYTATRLNI